MVNSTVSDFRFPGQRLDVETGLHYNAMRYYDPETGRYITTDPIGLAGGMNPYLYTEADPVNWVDPWGLTAAVAVMPPPVISGNQVGNLTPGQWSDMRNFLGLFDPRPFLHWAMNKSDKQCDDGAQDKYLGKKDERKLKKELADEGDTIENLKTPGGKGAGAYDLYVKPNGDIVVKPKGGSGPGEVTGWNISEL